MMKISNELKTGVVVLVALFAFFGVLYKTGDLNYAKKGYPVITRLHSVAGVKEFAPVRLNGMEVGEVRNINVVYNPEETLVEVTLWIEEGVKLRKDSLVTVGTLGLMGEKYIEIASGVSTDFIGPGEMVSAKNTVTMDELLTTFQEVGKDLQVTLRDVSHLVKNADGVIGDNREKVARIVDNIEEASYYVTDFTHDIKHHPWKVLAKGKEKTPEEMAQLRAEFRAQRMEKAPEEVETPEKLSAEAPDTQVETKVKVKSNFGTKRR